MRAMVARSWYVVRMCEHRSGWFRPTIGFLLALAFGASVARAAPFSRLIVFGDSLSDVGNIAAASLDIFPGPYYFNDRLSNGPVWVESLSQGLGLGPTVRSTAGGDNFAYGGAQTSGTGGFNGLFIRDIDEQVDQFLATRTADPNALFLVYAGSNDLIGGQANISIPINNLAEDIGRLVTAGARNLLVPNLPLLGHTPRFNGTPTTLATYNSRSESFNSALDMLLDSLQTSNPALAVYRLDVAALFSAALADPTAFGLTNVTHSAAPGLEPGDSAYNTSQIAANAYEYMFWDDVHPTATVHTHLAERALALFAVPGDYNRDGTVDAADYIVWRDGLGTTYTASDYDVWRAHFGQSFGNPPASGSQSAARSASTLAKTNDAVPEPATWWLVVFALNFIVTANHCRPVKP